MRQYEARKLASESKFNLIKQIIKFYYDKSVNLFIKSCRETFPAVGNILYYAVCVRRLCESASEKQLNIAH